MPFDGRTVYVRLWSLTGSTYEYYDYTYNTGTGPKATMISPAPGSVLTSTLVTFTWTPGAGVSQYILYFGTTPGGWESGVVNAGTTTSCTPTLPASGAAVYVRLWSSYGGVWVFTDYTYTAVTGVKAGMISPMPGSVLTSTLVTFTWAPGAGVSQYSLYFGTTPGGWELGAASAGTNTSWTATLPASGVTVYVRLWSNVGGAWVFNDYTYTALTGVRATMISPTPGSVLTGSPVTFTWTPGAGVTQYVLYFGTTPGGLELGSANAGALTSYAATLPTTPGLAIYVRLWSSFDGTWVFNDYAYLR
jgi:hypothetical protein